MQLGVPMPWRWSHLRVATGNPVTSTLRFEPFSLWWLALAAADETVQGGPLVRAWLGLFHSHLAAGRVDMRWRGDFAESAEMRRAYSALYGRYFARALLAARLGFTDFISLRRNGVQLGGGVKVRRIASGDIPDWIAWDPRRGGYVLGEAKGNLTGSWTSFSTGTPSCIGAGKAQFSRVRITDSAGQPVASRNWVAATLWSTEARPRRPISVLWDPAGEGRELSEDEVPVFADAIRRRRFAALATRLSGSTFRRSTRNVQVRVIAAPTEEATPRAGSRDDQAGNASTHLMPPDTSASSSHSDVYLAALITPLGIEPIRTPDDVRRLQALSKQRGPAADNMLLFGVSLKRTDDASRGETWLSSNGIASADGLGLFRLRGVTVEVEDRRAL